MGSDTYIIRLCTVINVQDDSYGLRIKVRLGYEDNGIEDKDLPYCFPLLPKMIHVNPRIGELVFVILQSQGQAAGNRFFIGPVISQPYFLNEEFTYQAQSLFQGAQIKKPLPHPGMNPENTGTLPDREDVAIQGRQNADLILKPNQLLLRCGFKKNPLSSAEQNLVFNNKDLAYIQLKYGNYKDNKNRTFNSVVNIVGDRINLLSHDSGTYFNLGDRTDLISDQELYKILENAHPLVYGDKLVSFLKQLIEVFKNHQHPWAQLPPCLIEPHQKVLSTNLDNLLSNAIHIN